MPSEHPLDRYDSPEPPRKWQGRATAVIVVAALVPLSFAGWLGWKAVTGESTDGRTAAGAPQLNGTEPSAAAALLGASSAPASAGASAPAGTPSSASASAAPAPTATGTGANSAATAAKPLAGKTVVIDPGHNPGNVNYTSRIDKVVAIGKGTTNCDTTGTSTNAGYSEARFTLDVARRVRTILQAEGAKVVFTQDGNLPWGPCVTQRAAIGNAAHADAAISIHGDGAGAGNRGFHVILPATVFQGGADTRKIVGPSRSLGLDVRSAFKSVTGEPFADYINGGTGLDVRSDLGGLNMSRVPKVFIECGNMRNATDAARMTSASWRQLAARGIAAGLTTFVETAH